MGKMDLVTLIVNREQLRNLQLAKLESVSREELVEGLMAMRARDIITIVRLLVSQVGKEKAKKFIEEAQYSISYKRGKEAAQKAGNPKDIDGYIEANTIGLLSKIPAACISEVVERTENR